MVTEILKNYAHNSANVQDNLAKLLLHGKLNGTGKLLILPVDQGFEHGPDESFFLNPPAYDPEYHVNLAIEAGLSAYAAPLGMIEAVAYKYSSKIPLILKLNSGSKLFPKNNEPEQAFIATAKEALKLGCVGIGLTIYPGSARFKEMLEKAAKIIAEAKENGLLSMVWSYPRGGGLQPEEETALDIISYGAHMACLIGADIIKVKPPTGIIATPAVGKLNIFNHTTTLAARVKAVKRSCFAGKRLVLFSGGKTKQLAELYEEIHGLKEGGADGSIIGRNAFQRPFGEALIMLENIINIYKQAASSSY